MSFKLVALVITVVAVVSGLALSVSPHILKGSNDDKQEVLRVVERFFISLENFNEDELKKILSDEPTVGTTGKNEIRGRKEYVTELKGLTERVTRIDTDEVDVTVRGEKAKVELVLRMRWASDDDLPTEHAGRYVISLGKSRGRWSISSIILQTS